jgi:hypothetical protein
MLEGLVTMRTAMQTGKMTSSKRKSSSLESNRIVHGLGEDDVSGWVKGGHARPESHTFEVAHELRNNGDIWNNKSAASQTRVLQWDDLQWSTNGRSSSSNHIGRDWNGSLRLASTML